MDRLTGYTGYRYEAYDPIDTKYDFSETNLQKLIDKLAHYEDMEEAGRLVVLPCKVGGIVWVSKNKEKTRMVFLHSIADILWYMEHGYGIGYTRKEAEAALKGE